MSPRSEIRKRTSMAAVRLLPSELERLRRAASDAGMSVGEWIRFRCIPKVSVGARTGEGRARSGGPSEPGADG